MGGQETGEREDESVKTGRKVGWSGRRAGWRMARSQQR
jgi:hypothetical protein